jgi:acetoin utilization deacetylase AcuC-like enzyme
MATGTIRSPASRSPDPRAPVVVPSLTLLTSEHALRHAPPEGHPERIDRARVLHAVAARHAAAGDPVEAAPPATPDALALVHTPDYVDAVLALDGRTATLDPDTFVSPGSVTAARHAAGAAVRAVDLVLDGAPGTRAAALVRPPGHHAEPARAMGFCLFNNIAVAAAHARARGLARVAVIDYDVHHGNGTQAAFLADPSVLFLSSHQFPFYPGTGAASEVGEGNGRGFTINLPLAAGAGDADLALVYEAVAVPVLEQFRPELMLLSAGFDAHEADLLGGMRATAAGFGRLTAMLAAVATRVCAGRLVAVTEGGYDLAALEASLGAMVAALEDRIPAPDERPAQAGAARGERTRAEAARRLAPYWQL